MKRVLVIVLVFAGTLTVSCNKNSCPAYEDNTNKMKLEDNSKTKSGALPKGKN